MKEIKFDKNSLIIDGKREFIRSGAFHYFRSPGEKIAKDRFMKLKSGGYNAVDIYFHWQFHCSEEGCYDFSGVKDIKKVLETARACGLYVIARPGPFINAEVNAGGLPFWLLKKEGVVPRNRIGTSYCYSEKYMACVKNWYENIIPIINEFDNVIAFQIENEYATDEMDEGYFKELYDYARSLGVKCPIFHNDAYNAGLWADNVDIYASDLYPYINPNQNWREDNYCFDTVDNLEEMVRSVKNDAPMFVAELQAGWFDKWDGSGYRHIRNALGSEHINIMTKTAISQGVTMFNHYMAVGGTSWGNLACDEVYTSYEFAAPIDEYGCLHSNYFKAKEINYFLEAFGLTKTEALPFDYYHNLIYTKLREDKNNNCKWLFVRNLNSQVQELDFPFGFSSKIKSYDMKICPVNLKLYACEIEFCDAELFTKIENDNKQIVFVFSDDFSYIKLKECVEKIHTNRSFDEKLVFNKNGKITEFIFLPHSLAEKTWKIGNKVIVNADLALSDNGKIKIGLVKSSKVTIITPEYELVKEFEVKKHTHPIQIGKPDVKFCANEIDTDFDYSDWKEISDKTDALSIGAYDEFIWYKTQIPDNVEEISLSARHLFALYINGREVLSRNSYKIEKLKQIPETIQVCIDKKVLNKEKNELTILVQNLGFDKGFSGETNDPRGLVSFSTIPKTELTFKIREKLAPEIDITKESKSPYLAKITFDFENTDDSPKYLLLKDFPFRRAIFLLNGVKIGRFMKRACVQEKFFLPDAFLQKNNKLDIIVWQKERNIFSEMDFKYDMENIDIEINCEKWYEFYEI